MPYLYEDTVRGDSRNALTIPASRAQVLEETFAQAYEENPLKATSRWLELREDERTGPKLDAESARSRLRDSGLENDLKISDSGITEAALETLMERKRTERRRQEIFARAEGTATETAQRFGLAFATTLADPLSAGLNFVPIVGQARYGRWLANAKTLAGRAAVRARTGAIEGAAGAAIAEVPIYTMRTQEQADYDMTDSLLNIAFGGVVGAGLHTTVGAAAELVERRLPGRVPLTRTEPVIAENAPEPLPADVQRVLFEQRLPADIERALGLEDVIDRLPPEVQHAALRTAVGQAVEGRAVDVQPILGAAEDVATPEFRGWFRESKVSDPAGQPMTVFHGTRARDQVLESGFVPSRDGGIYFTNNPREALKFAAEFHSTGGTPKVMKARLRIEKPYEVDADGEVFEPAMLNRAITAAKDGGHDGVIVRNIRNFEHSEPTDTFVVFKPEQARGVRQGLDRPLVRQPEMDTEYASALERADETLAREIEQTPDAMLKAAEDEATLAETDARSIAERLGVKYEPDETFAEGLEKAEKWARVAELATVCLVRGG